MVEIQKNYQTNICAMLAIHIGLRRLFPVDKTIPSRKPCQLLIFQQEIMLTYIESLRIKHEHDTDIHQWEWVLIPLNGIIVLNLFIAYNNINHRVRFCGTRTIDEIAKANRRLNKIPKKGGFHFSFRDFMNSYLIWKYCFFIFLFTVGFSPLISFVGMYIWAALSPDNYFASRQAHWKCHVINYSMTAQWDQVNKQLLNPAGYG